MNDDSPDSRYLIADRPVNRRTAPPALRASNKPSRPVPPRIVTKLRHLRGRHPLGTPLLEACTSASNHAGGARQPAPVQSIIGLMGGSGMLSLALLAETWPVQLLGGGGALMLFAGTWWSLWRSRQRGEATTTPATQPPLMDEQALGALDTVLNTIAPEISPTLLAQLKRLKDSLVEVIRWTQIEGVSDASPLQDHLYLQECIRRYLPDSLQAYLRIPAAQRQAALGSGGPSAEEALAQQLALIQDELDRQKSRLTKASSEPLLRQQRFLQAKSRRGC